MRSSAAHASTRGGRSASVNGMTCADGDVRVGHRVRDGGNDVLRPLGDDRDDRRVSVVRLDLDLLRGDGLVAADKFDVHSAAEESRLGVEREALLGAVGEARLDAVARLRLLRSADAQLAVDLRAGVFDKDVDGGPGAGTHVAAKQGVAR